MTQVDLQAPVQVQHHQLLRLGAGQAAQAFDDGRALRLMALGLVRAGALVQQVEQQVGGHRVVLQRGNRTVEQGGMFIGQRRRTGRPRRLAEAQAGQPPFGAGLPMDGDLRRITTMPDQMLGDEPVHELGHRLRHAAGGDGGDHVVHELPAHEDLAQLQLAQRLAQGDGRAGQGLGGQRNAVAAAGDGRQLHQVAGLG